MLQPKRTKYRKQHKGRNDGLAWCGNAVSFGEYGLKSTATGQLTSRQIEAARRSISRYVKRGGKMWIRVYRTSRSPEAIEVRMARARATSSSGRPGPTGRMITKSRASTTRPRARHSPWPRKLSVTTTSCPDGALRTQANAAEVGRRTEATSPTCQERSAPHAEATGQLAKTHEPSACVARSRASTSSSATRRSKSPDHDNTDKSSNGPGPRRQQQDGQDGDRARRAQVKHALYGKYIVADQAPRHDATTPATRATRCAWWKLRRCRRQELAVVEIVARAAE